MWMNFNLDGSKQLSQVELLTLCLTPDDEVLSAPKIIERIQTIMSGHYAPKRGSIYPILHRLSSHGLLEQDHEKGKMAFIRSSRGSSFISTITADLLNQLRSNFIFTTRILSEITKIDPFASLQIISDFRDDVINFSEEIELLRKQAKEIDQQDGWTDIPLG